MPGRWFVIAKHEETCRIQAVHERGGSLIYKKEMLGKPEFWWVFYELNPGMETPDAKILSDGQTCCMLYPSQEEHVLAVVYAHRPWVGYPRFWQIPPDDLPPEVREGSYYGKEEPNKLFFPSYDKLPSTMHPIYAALCVSAPGHVSLEELMKEVVVEADKREGADPQAVPGA